MRVLSPDDADRLHETLEASREGAYLRARMIAKNPPPPEPPRPIQTKIFGVTFVDQFGRDPQEFIADLDEGDELHLVRDPENPASEDAILVLDPRGRQLGFIGEDLARDLAPRMDDGDEFSAEVTAITGGGPGRHWGCNICIRQIPAQTYRPPVQPLWSPPVPTVPHHPQPQWILPAKRKPKELSPVALLLMTLGIGWILILLIFRTL